MYLGVGSSVWVSVLSRSLQFLHLDQACVEYFISNLADGHVCTVGDDKRISCCRGVNETNYFM